MFAAPALKAMKDLFQRLYPRHKDAWQKRAVYMPGLGLTITPPKGIKEMLVTPAMMAQAQKEGLDAVDFYYASRQEQHCSDCETWLSPVGNCQTLNARSENELDLMVTKESTPTGLPYKPQPLLMPGDIKPRIHNLAAVIRKLAGSNDPLFDGIEDKVSPLVLAIVKQQMEIAVAAYGKNDLAKRAEFKFHLASGRSMKLLKYFTQAVIGELLAVYVYFTESKRYKEYLQPDFFDKSLPAFTGEAGDQIAYSKWNDGTIEKLCAARVFNGTEPMALTFLTKKEGEGRKAYGFHTVNLMAAHEFISYATGEQQGRASNIHQMVSHALTCSSMACLASREFFISWPMLLAGSNKIHTIVLGRMVEGNVADFIGALLLEGKVVGHLNDETAAGELMRSAMQSIVQETGVYKNPPKQTDKLLQSLENLALPPELSWTNYRRTNIADVARYQVEKLYAYAPLSDLALNELDEIKAIAQQIEKQEQE